MSDKPANKITPFNLKEIKYESNLEKLAREVGVNRHDLRNLLDKKLKPGIKMLGKRFGSNIDTMAGYLNEVRKKNLAKPPKSQIVRSHPQSVNPGAPITSKARLKWFAKQHEIPHKVIQDAIDAVKTKGWDEGKAIKQLLKTLDNEEVPSDQIRKFIEDQTKKITDPRGLRIDRLKEHVTKNTDIRWRTIQNALDMGKSPKQLLNDLKGNLGQDEHRYAEGLQKEFKKWNANRRALKSAGSKIVKFENLDKIAKNLYDYQKQFGTKYGLIPQDTIKQLLQKGYGLERLKTQLEVRLQPPTDWHTKVIDRGFKETLGLIDDKGNPIAANKISAGPNAKWKPMRSLKDLSIDAYNTGTPTTKLTGDNLKLWNAYATHQNEEHRKWERRTRRTNRNRLERIEAGRARQLKIRNLASGLKGAATQLGAGIVINALADKFVKPHTDALGRRLGTSLGRWAKDFDEEHQKKKNAKKKKEK